MKWTLIIILTAAMSVVGFAQQEAPLVLPEGDGKAILEGSCQSCHNLNGIRRKAPMNQEGWEGLIKTMKDYGTELDDEKTKIVVDYLVKNFGPPEHPGLKIMQGACVGCHDASLTTSQTKDKAGWELTIKGMIGKGAAITNEEVPILLDYLVTTYGAPAATPAPQQ